MEQSKNKSASNMLRVVSLLCIILILAITVFTFTSKKENPVKEDITKSSESVVGTVSEKNSVESESENESARETNDEKSTDAIKEGKATQKDEKSPKQEDAVKPTAVKQKPEYELPVNGSITKSYSVDIPVYSLTMNDYRAHTGIDISCEQGSAVSACEAGIIKDICFDPMMGHTVTIEHNDGVCSSYMNLSENFPEDIIIGAAVSKGQLIGAVASSAMVEIASEPHLHFEMTAAGAYVDPLTMIDVASISVMSENIVD